MTLDSENDSPTTIRVKYMPFHLGVFDLLMSWLNFMSKSEAADQAAEEAAVQRYLETMDEGELQKLLEDD